MPEYILNPEVVRTCMRRLIEASIHRMYPGYLCLTQQASQSGRTENLPFPYFDFFDAYLRVRDGEKPYLIPFTQAENPDDASLWLNANISGTYAPSSLRSTAALLQVAEIQEGGYNAKWRLKDDHWRLARHHLCGGDQLPVESLAVFLFRDYSFQVEEPDAYTLVSTFAEEFGYEMSSEQFTQLYESGDSAITPESFDGL